MTSIFDLFLNSNSLTKNESLNESAQRYKSTKSDLFIQTPALSQGEKFKKYQKKIKKRIENQIENINFREGFNGNNDTQTNSLTAQSNNIIKRNDYSSREETINDLKQKYQNTLNEYEKLLQQINGNITNYLDRINPNNPYLNKTVRFTTGHIAYVTNQGVVKYIPSTEIFNSLNIEKQYIQLSIPWNDSWNNNPGAIVPTNPPLISGTFAQFGESLSNAGSNVFVNTLLNNPSNSYIGCYNNIPPSTEVLFIPVMNNNNESNGYKSYSSSVYQGNNQWGAWAAFDRNTNDFWHSEVSSSTNYNGSTGDYIGTNYKDYTNLNGQSSRANGEYVVINLPNVNTSNATNILLTKYDIQGRQGCCGNPNGRSPNSWIILGWNGSNWYEVDKRDNESLNYEMKTYYITNPKPYQSYMFLTTNCGNPGDKTGNRYCVQISQWNLYTSSNYINNPPSAMNNVGQMNFHQCETYALNSDNKYFGLQNVDDAGNGNCMVSNDLANSQKYDVSYIYKGIPLWASNTEANKTNNPGSTVTLTNSGSLSVLNSSGQSVFTSESSKANPGNYLGCYNDCYSGRGLPTFIADGKTYESCQSAAKEGNWTYFGLQYTQANGTSQCFVGNDITSGMSMGKASNCTTSNGVPVGGSCSNAIYNNSSPTSNYYLTLQDDGNMCVYRGTSPSDNQGLIWQSETNGKQQTPNPNFAAVKGKYGKNWMPSGSTLAIGDFIGSSNGNIYLIMQSDGNLVLYTNQQENGCKAFNKTMGINVGQQNINALYQINDMGIKNNIGKLAYIDEDSKLHAYSEDNIQYSNTYTKMNGINCIGHDIPNASYANATVESCENTCNSNSKCAGFTYISDNKLCYPKYSSMYPNDKIQINSNIDLYLRGKSPAKKPSGIPNTVNNVDTNVYQNYINGGALETEYGLSNITKTQKQQLEKLQSKLNSLSSKISELTGQFGMGSQQAQVQSQQNYTGINDYLKGIKNTNEKIQNFNTNIENILSDSDIVVLQKNYNYIFWSILAAITLLVTVNIVKK